MQEPQDDIYWRTDIGRILRALARATTPVRAYLVPMARGM